MDLLILFVCLKFSISLWLPATCCEEVFHCIIMHRANSHVPLFGSWWYLQLHVEHKRRTSTGQYWASAPLPSTRPAVLMEGCLLPVQKTKTCWDATSLWDPRKVIPFLQIWLQCSRCSEVTQVTSCQPDVAPFTMGSGLHPVHHPVECEPVYLTAGQFVHKDAVRDDW